MSELEKQVDALMQLAVADNPEDAAEARKNLRQMMKGNSGITGCREDSLDLKSMVGQILLELGTPDHLGGHSYIITAIALAAQNPIYIRHMTSELYPMVAKMHDTTASRAERAIRHAIEITWSRGEADVLMKYFGNTVSPAKGKPTNGEFIARLSNHVRQQLKDAA